MISQKKVLKWLNHRCGIGHSKVHVKETLNVPQPVRMYKNTFHNANLYTGQDLEAAKPKQPLLGVPN